MKRLFTTVVLLAFIVAAYGQNGNDWRKKVDPSLLEKTANGQSMPFLILLAQKADLSAARQLRTKDEKATYVFNNLRQTANASQANLKAFLSLREIPHQGLYIVNAIMAKGDLSLIGELARRSDVAKIAGNPNMRYAEPVQQVFGAAAERVAIEWGIDMINANDAWDLGYTGQGVTIGGQDTGYDWSHPALKSKYRGYFEPTNTANHHYNWHDAIHSISPLSADSLNPCGLDSPVPCDDNSHGTHTMGTMVGDDGAGNQVGVAPGANWCACRNMERGNGSPFTYLECFQWFLAPTDLDNQNPDPTKAPHVINNSWYCSESEGCNPTNFYILEEAVTNLRLAGTVVVVSAGNAGSNCSTVTMPALFENSFAIGATAINDSIVNFSSRGPIIVDGSNRLKPNVCAPGANVRSSVPGGGYANFWGTSMAGPHVAGLVALVISANPELAGQVDVIENIIEQTAVPKTTDEVCGTIPGTQVPNNTYGFGRVDALAAVEAAIALIPPNAVNEPLPLAVRVYPNPVGHQLYFEVKNALGDVQVELFDINGRSLAQRHWSAASQGNASFDLTGLPAGIYFYRVLSGGEVQKGKVVKE